MYHSLRVLWLLQHKTMSVKDRKHWAWIAALIFHVCSELLLNRSRRNRTCTRNWNFKSNDIIIFHENLIDIRCLYSPFQSDVFFFPNWKSLSLFHCLSLFLVRWQYYFLFCQFIKFDLNKQTKWKRWQRWQQWIAYPPCYAPCACTWVRSHGNIAEVTNASQIDLSFYIYTLHASVYHTSNKWKHFRTISLLS